MKRLRAKIGSDAILLVGLVIAMVIFAVMASVQPSIAGTGAAANSSSSGGLTDLYDRHTPDELQQIMSSGEQQPLRGLTDLYDRHTPEELRLIMRGESK